MTDRLSALDVSFLYAEQPSTPMHLGGVAVLDPSPGGFDHERFVSSVEQRITHLPRYRQKVLEVAFRLARPLWMDDVDVDVRRHVRRVVLPAPGSEGQLCDLAAQVTARPLDRRYPLWELHLVDGLVGGRTALVHQVHHALLDGVAAVNAAGVMFDRAPGPARGVPVDPPAEPAATPLPLPHVRPGATRPSAAALLPRVAGDVAVTVRTATRARSGPLNVPTGRRRAFGMARTRLDDHRRICHTYGVTVNDVALAAVTGALRTWLARRGELARVPALRALVPVSVRAPGRAPTSGNRLSSYFVDLPVADPDSERRLRVLARAGRAHRGRGQSVGVGLLVRLSGHAPTALYGVAARTVNVTSRHLFNLAVSNVRGPRHTLYVAGVRVAELFPVVPLAHRQGLSIGLVSYQDGVHYGLNADRDAVPDVDTLATDVEQAVGELLGGTR